jgi:hypothetical protein
MPKSVTVTLAGQQYTVQELPSRRNAEWRAKLDETLAGVSDALGKSMKLSGLQDVVDAVRALLLGGIGTVMDLLCEYAPEVDADRERIEAEVYDSEIVTAFTEVCTLAFPFGSLLRLGMTGPARPGTSPKSPAASGDSGTTSSTGSRKRSS